MSMSITQDSNPSRAAFVERKWESTVAGFSGSQEFYNEGLSRRLWTSALEDPWSQREQYALRYGEQAAEIIEQIRALGRTFRASGGKDQKTADKMVRLSGDLTHHLFQTRRWLFEKAARWR